MITLSSSHMALLELRDRLACKPHHQQKLGM